MKTIAEVIAEHYLEALWECSCGWRATRDDFDGANEEHAAHIAQAIRDERTVWTLPELDALPAGTIIRAESGIPLVLAGGGWIDAKAQLGGRSLPALVLWIPGDGL